MGREVGMMRRRRSLLFMPGDDAHKIEKGAGLDVDCVVMDIEDGVALSSKVAARETIRDALTTIDFGTTERLVRINPVGSGLEDDDLAVVTEGRPDGYIIPKIESADQVRWVSNWLARMERERDWPERAIRLLALIESARGLLAVERIAAASRRLDALIFGAEDFAGDIGATRTAEGQEVLYARSSVVIAAAAYNLQAIDTIFADLHDDDGLRTDAEFALQLGYEGKLAIHPRQVAIIHDVFTPTDEQVEQARHLIEAFEDHREAGTGAFEYGGKMVDVAIVRAARRILARAGADGA